MVSAKINSVQGRSEMKELFEFCMIVLLFLGLGLMGSALFDRQNEIKLTQKEIQMKLSKTESELHDIKTELIVMNGICQKVLNNEW